MSKNVVDVLLSLSELDSSIAGLSARHSIIEEQQLRARAEIEQARLKLENAARACENEKNKHASDSTKLEVEQKKIVDRRKALSDLGGAKSARLVEREIDIAQRSLQSLEEQALRSMDDMAELEHTVDELKSNLEDLQKSFEETNSGLESEIGEISKEITAKAKKRVQMFAKLDDRVRTLYERVCKRHPESPVAVAARGSCRTCYRALPSQTYNQIIAGNLLIQCPGCSRVLVYTGEQQAEKN